MKLDEYITEAIDNIRTDRETTKELLNDAINYMSSKHDAHETVGNIAAKYVETLQRSNEQLVKVMSLLQKREGKQERTLAPQPRERHRQRGRIRWASQRGHPGTVAPGQAG